MTTITLRQRVLFSTRPTTVLYRIPTLLLALLFVGSAALTFLDLPLSISEQERLGFPGWTSPIAGVLKFLGAGTLIVNALTENRFGTLTYFAFAGFLYDMLLALGGHIATNDPGIVLAIVGLIIWVFAFIAHQRRFAPAPGLAGLVP